MTGFSSAPMAFSCEREKERAICIYAGHISFLSMHICASCARGIVAQCNEVWGNMVSVFSRIFVIPV